MFKEQIHELVHPLTTQYINKLAKPSGEFDLCLTMLGIACFRKRVDNYIGIKGCCFTGSYANNFEETKVYLLGEEHNENYFYYFRNCSDKDKTNDMVKYLSGLNYKHENTVENLIQNKFGADTNINILFFN